MFNRAMIRYRRQLVDANSQHRPELFCDVIGPEYLWLLGRPLSDVLKTCWSLMRRSRDVNEETGCDEVRSSCESWSVGDCQSVSVGDRGGQALRAHILKVTLPTFNKILRQSSRTTLTLETVSGGFGLLHGGDGSSALFVIGIGRSRGGRGRSGGLLAHFQRSLVVLSREAFSSHEDT